MQGIGKKEKGGEVHSINVKGQKLRNVFCRSHCMFTYILEATPLNLIDVSLVGLSRSVLCGADL